MPYSGPTSGGTYPEKESVAVWDPLTHVEQFSNQFTPSKTRPNPVRPRPGDASPTHLPFHHNYHFPVGVAAVRGI